jgi:hypothetical protein
MLVRLRAPQAQAARRRPLAAAGNATTSRAGASRPAMEDHPAAAVADANTSAHACFRGEDMGVAMTIAASAYTTIQRLNALKPGQRFRYLCTEKSTTGPLCQALVSHIQDHARGLQLADKIAIETKSRSLDVKGIGKRGITVTEYWATGRERKK